MQVATLSFVSTPVAMPNGHEPSRSKSGFAGILSGLTKKEPLNPIVELNMKNDSQQLSNEELRELVQLINSQNLTEIESGTQILEKLLADAAVDLEEMILLSLEGNSENLKTAISSLLQNSKINKDVSNAEPVEDELANLIDELSQMDTVEAMMAFMQLLPSLDWEPLTFKADQSFSNLVKTLKSLELMSNYEKTNIDQQSLKAFMQKLEDTLEVILKDNSSRREYLQKVFTPIVKATNENTAYNQQRQPGLSSKEQTSADILNEKNSGMFQFQQLSKLEQLTLMIDKSNQTVSTEKLIQQFEQILSKSQLFKSGGTQRLFIKLNPEHLGLLKIELIQKDTGILAKIITTTGTAKDLLESQLQSLKAAFGLQNIQLDRIEISQQMNGQERFLARDFQQEQQKQQQEEMEEENKQLEQDQNFSHSFEEALLSEEA